jgi:glutaredoxin-related protein
MSKNILYYSTYCKNCDKLLNILNKSNLQSTLNFINIDKRVTRNNSIYIILNDEKEILLPVTITKVPALLLIDNGHQVLFGNQIYQHLQPKEKQYNQDKPNYDEPSSFSLDNNICSIYGVVSDNFS